MICTMHDRVEEVHVFLAASRGRGGRRSDSPNGFEAKSFFLMTMLSE
jgi:hypothetical protein